MGAAEEGGLAGEAEMARVAAAAAGLAEVKVAEMGAEERGWAGEATEVVGWAAAEKAESSSLPRSTPAHKCTLACRSCRKTSQCRRVASKAGAPQQRAAQGG